MPKVIKIGVTKIKGFVIKPGKGARRTKRRRERDAELEGYASSMRKYPTTSEKMYCELLDKLKIEYEFQKVLCGYIPDFYFPKQRKVIELDGVYHKDRRHLDRKRDKVLKANGHKVLRVPSHLIFSDVDKLIELTRRFLLTKKPKKPVKEPQVFDAVDPVDAFMFVTEGI